MPGSLALASVAAGAVFPQSLCTSYTESQSYPVLTNQYKDGTLQISLIQDGVNLPRTLRVWKLSKKLTVTQLATLQAFYYQMQQGTGTPPGTTQPPTQPFYFYSPFDQTPGTPIASNYDPTGVSVIGRVTVNFKGDFSFTVQLLRVEVSDLSLVEVA
jgi:hypothetical protein